MIQPHEEGKLGGAYIYLISLVAAAGGFLFGYDLAIISGALPFLENYFGLDAAAKGLAVSSAVFGSILGPLVGMWLVRDLPGGCRERFEHIALRAGFSGFAHQCNRP